MSITIIPVIMCGGSGSRLWPVSREQHPKPFIRLADGSSLIQKALLRALTFDGVKEIITVTNKELLFKAVDAFSEVYKGTVPISYILEPVGRNTTAAIASAALLAHQKYGDDAVLMILAADHLIKDHTAFIQAVSEASQLAKQSRLVTFGIQPEKPETGYGYIKYRGNLVEHFVEKPSYNKALEYLESGKYLWNSGMFCFSCGTILKEMEMLCPQVLSDVKHSMSLSRRLEGGGATQLELDMNTFSQVEDISIDYAVMEKSRQVSVVSCNIGWCDIGSWTALGALIVPDENGNAIEGDAEILTHNATNCYIKADERVIGAVGVDNLVIVDTPDALLVASKDSGQDVKSIYNQLKNKGHQAYKIHRTVHRPWGTSTVLEQGHNFKINSVLVKPGAKMSMQLHHHRSEHWIVMAGATRIVNGNKHIFLSTNQSTYIPPGEQHRIENPGVIDLIMIEVQSGEYLGDDDIVRFDENGSVHQ
ncbi:mannose-1-phosphate guanylyltransferase/mannose-6-phosphate isomerase [Prodigiosinella aquatilis]|uniref:mannose-1-phosphate guanylyltransferase/mannose-6-phosphate isomerase n=1 Tax=Brenneria uluponensis TaxID=3057057 RepID=UPI0025B5FF6A|nr:MULTISPECIES: mannose-1-phosphate guanylyltransferase/mannose-6-phosphate isomerase [Pectobacteriaceae]WJV54590.1 mannose-1-phosphate guanylyltransferase/mannose-6-phosphate isomerase [Prodigiosinella sp. LS101]WJV58952.1 mannose-1-phosphate guanylyltransferase/mannose-6-phosphate isomerase [Pectobacteriaceae bacterium C111]